MRLRRLNNCGSILAGYPFRAVSSIASFAATQSDEFDTYQEGAVAIIEPSVTGGIPRRLLITRNNTLDYSDDLDAAADPLRFYDMVKDKDDVESFQNFRPYISQRISSTDAITATNFLYCRQVGSRVKLTWEKNTETDFFKYVLLWDEGLGGTPATELASIQDPDETTYITDALSDGTYQFLLVFEDICGNQGVDGGIDYAKTATIIVSAAPDAPTAEISYSSTTRTATLIVETTDNVVVHSNHLIQYGLLTRPQFFNKCPLTLIGDDTYETPVLFAGTWKFNVYAANKYGVYSEPVELTLGLVEKDGSLLDVTPIETAPILEAEQYSSSRINLTWSPDTPTDHVAEIYASADGVTYIYESSTANSTYIYQGVDGVEYWFKVRFNNTQGDDPVIDVYSDWSNEVSETADGTPPDGDQTLTGKLL